MSAGIKLIVGLGNPGKRYAQTRHNAGFMVLDGLAEKFSVAWKGNLKFSAELCEIASAGNKIFLIKPQTFMNRSGDAVAAIASFYKINPDDILVVYDDLDLPFGKIRIRKGGSSGGHNGIKSIAERVGSEDFPRVRVGIGKPQGQVDTASWVLDEFSSDECREWPGITDRAVSAVSVLLSAGLAAAQAEFN